MESQMKEYARQLEADTRTEKERHEKNLENLAKRKEELIRERRAKMKVGVARVVVWLIHHYIIV